MAYWRNFELAGPFDDRRAEFVEEPGGPLGDGRAIDALDHPFNARVFQQLADRGVAVQYDAAALSQAGIDLGKQVNVEVENAAADEFFKAICDPLGLKFAIDGTTVALTPK